MTGPPETVMRIRDLRVGFDTPDGRLPAVDGVDLDLRRGEILALVGESGSGKSALTMSLVGLNRGPRTHVSGQVEFGGRNLVEASEAELREVRGRDVAVVFQDSLAALNPLHRAGAQVSEMLRLHQPLRRAAAWERAEELLDDVGIANPARTARSYPHQLSGGMRQRVMIATGLANEPAVLIADEPTTALDVTIQAQVLELLRRLRAEHDSSIVLITHDLGVVAEVADRVAVMYAGRVVEHGTRDEVLRRPRHPYTVGLLRSVPRIDGPPAESLFAIPGAPLTGVDRPEGCAFRPRCADAVEECGTRPPLRPREPGSGHLDACVREPATAGNGGAR
ncbi:Oligopeptide transport ATP-binding protein OppD [Pseudonocardia sp. Ae406_Ps2]|uniref:ABC transporter ATP-binding protein n=1 Tax=unclassified Pseudonocardia TaxID=2619320 RepID=UPI00095BB47A|nr:MULTISPECIES: ABC transporter ATP-binding protein [unclassified Pseudonocardia]OLL99846.1 Oligopeptide transport ATP-binding protein OppD [Pseudonocardia sp. Ae331_Ps2]OLM02404.1 Oligopeptide transport ATP-binding protein OppD [Pseudonocardia sp. Ae406_Ps2]OLM12760.1 Oligopeptide transport ATP-binding protein OppD [Pseudonocardia sp. Ae505_Ps2]OLM23975.1 Oligopeptide transport ATP-binding protein OppD [Pseudonocardia sp. Ae706_Ps2]OLM30073.1 Oligopeptide transport ATP-binding protein OppD [